MPWRGLIGSHVRLERRIIRNVRKRAILCCFFFNAYRPPPVRGSLPGRYIGVTSARPSPRRDLHKRRRRRQWPQLSRRNTDHWWRDGVCYTGRGRRIGISERNQRHWYGAKRAQLSTVTCPRNAEYIKGKNATNFPWAFYVATISPRREGFASRSFSGPHASVIIVHSTVFAIQETETVLGLYRPSRDGHVTSSD